MTFRTVRGLTMHHRIEGEGPPLVFINSLGSDLRIWDEVAPHLRNRRLVRYDKRGHGLSDAPSGPYAVDDLAEDLRALLDALDVVTPALVGISVGGLIAQAFAAHHPERVRALVLCDTGAKIGDASSWEARMAMVRREGLEAVAEGIVERWFAPGFAARDPATHRGFANMLSRTPVEGYLGTCAALRDADLTARAEAITAPTLVLCGAHDQATPPSLAEALAARIRGARLELIPDAGHLPCIEQPHRLARAIRAFLEELDDG